MPPPPQQDLPEETLDNILQSDHGKAWFRQWVDGTVDDDMVRRRWGKNVLELFCVAQVMEDDSFNLENGTALKNKVAAEEAAQTQLQQDVSQDHEGVDQEGGEIDGMAPVETRAPRAWTGLRESDEMGAVTEEERARLVVEGAIASVTGYVAPMEEGQVDAEEVVIFEGGREDIMDEADELEGRPRDGDITRFMQRDLSITFGQHLNKLLKELEDMPKAKAARLARFLEQMLVDYKRPSPHLRRPRLVECQHRLTALLSVFAEDEAELRGDERNWCLNSWQNLLRHLEDLEPEVDEELPEPPRPSSSNVVEVVDSQNVQENGATRPLNDEEERQIQENELWEEEASYQLRKEDEQLWDEFQASELRTWETWMVRSGQVPQGVKRARVQVLVQGEGGRIIKRENWMFGLREGEFLSYNVNIHAAEDSDAEDAGDPAAASSEDRAPPTVQDDGEGAARLDTLPVTGLAAPDMRSGPDVSRGRELEVAKFVQSRQGELVFQEWRNGKLTDRAVGQQYGYGVLGHFYGQRDWESGTFGEDSSPSMVTTSGPAHGVNPAADGSCAAVEEVPGGAAAGDDNAALAGDVHEQEGEAAPAMASAATEGCRVAQC